MRRAVTSQFLQDLLISIDRSGDQKKKKKKKEKNGEKKGEKFEMVIGANRKLNFLEIGQDPRGGRGLS